VTRFARDNPIAIGALGCVAYVLIGWTGLIAPSLIRSIEADLVQTDTAIGFFYFLYGVAYAVGSLGGGYATERLGRRLVLASAVALHGVGVGALGMTAIWPAFLACALPAGLSAGAIDGGINGLFLDLFRTRRGRALNMLHLFFSVGAFTAPLVIGQLVSGGAPWRLLYIATGLFLLPFATLFAFMRLPHGRHTAQAMVAGVEGPVVTRRLLFLWPLPMLALAIGTYVASEVGVSNWLVRFLSAAPLDLATVSLSLYWGGLAVGRLVSARIADRFDHARFTAAWALMGSGLLVFAVIVPSMPLSIVGFGIVGFAFGPIFPMIMAIGGERFPERSAAVGGLLTTAAVGGGVAYPAIMGVLSDTVGLPAAMLGTALLGFACSACVFLARGRRGERGDEARMRDVRAAQAAVDVDRF
jgi:fucose permease